VEEKRNREGIVWRGGVNREKGGGNRRERWS
jgi:hypothetical protein